MSSQRKILVTGASGFVGAQVVEHLLKAGYAVRGTSRSNKAEQLRNNCPHPNFEVIVVDDIIAGDFSEALQDINAVIHVASPMVGKESTIEVAIGGTMNIIRQAYGANVFKITIVGSYASLFDNWGDLSDGSRILTDKDWRKVAREDVKTDTPASVIYAASKTLAERAAWEFAESHPDLDLITLLPTFIFGPLARAHVLSDPTSLSTNGFLYQLLSRPTAAYPPHPVWHAVDVRDVAAAAVLSLSATKSLPGEQRRIILFGGTFTWREAVLHIARVRPDLKSRLVDGGDPPADQEEVTPINLVTDKVKEILGFSTVVGWKQTIEDAVESILQREAKGEI